MANWEKQSETDEWVIYTNERYPRVHISARAWDVSDAHSTVEEAFVKYHALKDGTYSPPRPSNRIKELLRDALDNFLSENRRLVSFSKSSMFNQDFTY